MVAQDPGKARLLVIDDHQLVREAMVCMLQSEDNLEIAGHCASAEEALRIIGSRRVDCVLLRYEPPTQVALPFITRACEINFGGRILILASQISVEAAHGLIAAGAVGILLKNCSREALCIAIAQVMAGQTWRTNPTLASGIPLSDRPFEAEPRFSAREKQVLRGVVDGLATKEISARLGISEQSVKWTLHQLFRRTGTRTRTQLARAIWVKYPELF